MSRQFNDYFFESGMYTLADPTEYPYYSIGDGFDYGVCKDGFVCNKDGHILTNKKGDKSGHQAVCLYKDGKRYYKYVHRLVAETFIPNPNDLPVVRHLNDDVYDNRVENLAWGTQKDNHNDAVRNGTFKPFDDEARQKMIETVRRPVRVIDIQTGEYEDFYSLNEACRQKHLQQSNAWKVLRSERRSVSGYRLEYLDKEAGY